MVLRQIIVSIITLAVWSSCNAAPRKLTQEDLRSLGTVTVISLMGDEFLLHHVGTTIFQNRYNKAEVSQWEIDRHTTDVATEFLELKGHVVKEVQYDAERLFKTYPAGWARAGRKSKRLDHFSKSSLGKIQSIHLLSFTETLLKTSLRSAQKVCQDMAYIIAEPSRNMLKLQPTSSYK